MLQEHWPRESQFHRIKNIHSRNGKILAHNVSAMDDGLLINGRGYGGCSILWKSTLNAKVTPILMHSNRVCAVQISIGLTNIIVFNVYMPCDTGANSGMYSEILQEIMAKCVE